MTKQAGSQPTTQPGPNVASEYDHECSNDCPHWPLTQPVKGPTKRAKGQRATVPVPHSLWVQVLGSLEANAVSNPNDELLLQRLKKNGLWGGWQNDDWKVG